MVLVPGIVQGLVELLNEGGGGALIRIPHAEIEDVLSKAAALDAAVKKLVETANKNGGEDNITVIAARAAAS